MKKILLTGATGMIGSAIIREAIKQNYEITCLVRKDSSRIKNIPNSPQVKIVDCNITDYSSLVLDDKYDVLIHLAWDKTSVSGRDDVDCQLKNIQYTLDAVRLAKRCGCSVFIGAGSQAEYGVQSVPLTPTLPVNPESGYGIAKYTAGKLSGLLCKQLGLRFNWMRILSVFGPNDGANTLISYCIRELKDGRTPELTKCEQTWDYLYCDDAARAFLAVAEKGIDGKVYPLGTGHGRQLSEYIEDIRDYINPKIKLGFGKKEYYHHQPMYLVADVSELEKDTGWKVEVEFLTGIKLLLKQV
ncbi:MAG: NAD(P)-dependent oxidoreductase [Spirochaetales bacterium]|nr:NAD(P)-dependent oxidoreductase [Spirochaetales bacterium]